MKYQVIHTTNYIYQSAASLCHNIMIQIPKDWPFQKVESFEYSISPEPSYSIDRIDFFENKYLYFSIEKSHSKLTVTAKSKVELSSPAWVTVNPKMTQPWEEVHAWLHSTDAMNDIRQFYLESKHVDFVDGIKEYALQSFTPGRPIMEAMIELNTRIFTDFTFTPGFTDISTPMSTVFETKKGVCQDFAHFSLACLRSIGLAARYVSGYIETLPPPGKPKLVGADASHAWIALYIPGLDWVEFDATNNLLVDDKHIRVAVGRDFADVTPLKGIVYSVGKQTMKVSVDVRRPEEVIL
ncbi:transglutaminase family protein [Reichenbachiella agarivorans]|uniref:Transglutaminase family protein n=1 Tax=Reichenbachiella agarivorans TaxID=2979464 RepID=A0ABY6CLS3_9BACT|nr:transglutaminase family protein [Reichenbachiella agarivorans]UXP31458.1 transglutaminase family protein [Reichenbachiella agarivorans]